VNERDAFQLVIPAVEALQKGQHISREGGRRDKKENDLLPLAFG
jgi:hypothetical protein